MTVAKEIRGRTVYLPEMAREAGVLTEIIFLNCRIVGPAVIAQTGHCQWRDSTFEHPDVFWPIEWSLDRRIFGCVIVDTCLFEKCIFEDVAILGPPEWVEIARSGEDFQRPPE